MRALSEEESAIYKRYADAKAEWEPRLYGRDAHKFTFAQQLEAHDQVKYNFRAMMMVKRTRQRERYEELRKKGRLVGWKKSRSPRDERESSMAMPVDGRLSLLTLACRR